MNTDNSKKLKIQTFLSILMIGFGLALLLYMIFVEDEPGLVPLLLIGFGTVWYFIPRARIRSQHT